LCNNRRIELNEHYNPLPTYKGDEIYRNGVFQYHLRSRVNEEYLSNVNVSKPVIQAGSTGTVPMPPFYLKELKRESNSISLLKYS
jgi:hypothetical protein